MPNALRMGGSKGRKAAPPKGPPDKKQALPGERQVALDANQVKVRDQLAGERRDVNGGTRGPAWLRRRYPPQAAGGATGAGQKAP